MMAPRFEAKPECREAVHALAEPGISRTAIEESVRELYEKYGGEESWTTIKAHGYKKVRELLGAREAKKSELVGEPEAKKSGPSEEQLAEAEVLCDLMAVPPEYLRGVLSEIYQNYGGQPAAWALIKGRPDDPEGLWAEVIRFIEQDGARPSPSDRDFNVPPSTGLLQHSDGALPSNKKNSQTNSLYSQAANLRERASTHSSAEPLQRPIGNPSPRELPHELHRRSGSSIPEVDLSPQQQALIDEVDQRAAGLAIISSRQAQHPSDGVPLSPRGQPALFPHVSEPQSPNRPPPPGFCKAPRAISGRWDSRVKHTGGAQLLEQMSSLPQHASLVRKSQDATEEAQRKRRREREHQAELRAKVGAIQRERFGQGQRSGGGVARATSAGDADRMGMEDGQGEKSAGLHSGVGTKGGALEQALQMLREVGSGALVAPERPCSSGEQETRGGLRGAPSGGAVVLVRNEGEAAAAVTEEGPSSENTGTEHVKNAGERGEFHCPVIDGAGLVGSERGEQLLGSNSRGITQRGGLVRDEPRSVEAYQDSGLADGVVGDRVIVEEGMGERRKLKRIRKVGERQTVENCGQKRGRREDGSQEAESSSAGTDLPKAESGHVQSWGPPVNPKGQSGRIKSLNALVQAPEKQQPDQKKEPTKRGKAEGKRTEAPAGVKIEKEGTPSKSSGHVTGGRGPKEERCWAAASGNAERVRAGRDSERVVSEDVSRGQERQKIRCVNGHTDDNLPRGFRYMRESKVFEKAQPFAPSCLALLPDNAQCECEGDCLAAAVPCGCTLDTLGSYAYDQHGRLDSAFLQKQIDKIFCPGVCLTQRAKMSAEERSTQAVPPCEGHPMFTKECSIKCLCHATCNNRVVQRGIAIKLEVFWAPGKGWGIRCLEDLLPGTFVCEYAGEILTTDELEERNRAQADLGKHFPVELNACPVTEDYVEDDTGLCLDATNLGNVARFINHRCGDATLIDVPVEIEGPKHNFYHLAFFTNSFVEAMTELTWDYGIDFDDERHPVKAFQCCCGSALCRG